jgi:3-deoxy-manno-octulosonate cytidylyltransferase (CMP-KDO synthetase)
MKKVIIIPARYQSSRFPGKPLMKILNKELILWVVEISNSVVGKKNTYVATDSLLIKNFLKNNKINYVMTSKSCLTGTDRVAEAAKKIKSDIYINLQGDEPLVKKSDIQKIINQKIKNYNNVICGYSSLMKNENPKNTNIPKILFNKNKKLIYASRLPIPGKKKRTDQCLFFKQVCVYAFNSNELKKFKNCKKKTYYESQEDIELLRFFDLDIDIKMQKMSSSSMAVDVKSDIKKIEKYLND